MATCDRLEMPASTVIRSTDVLAFGAAHWDTIARLSEATCAASVPGHTARHAGGAAFNVCRHLASAGLGVTLAVPHDDVAIEKAALAANVTLVPLAATEPAAPSYTTILDSSGDLVVACADMRAYDTLPPSAVASTFATIVDPDAVLLDANLPMPVLERIVDRFAGRAILAGLAVSPAKVGRFASVLGRLDVLFTSQAEREALGELDEHDLPRALIVTNGSRPIEIVSANTMDLVPVMPVRPVDVTGAGDALAGATLVHLLRGSDVTNAVRQACRVATHAVRHEGPFTPCPALAGEPT